jgi:hypothetical protein
MATLAKAISKTTGAAIIEFIGAQTTAYGKLTAVLDLLIADGHTDLLKYRAPAKDEDRTFYDSLVKYVVKGYPAKAQSLLAMPAKELTEAQKAEKRKWGMRKGRDIADIRNGMTKRLQREESKGATTPTADEVKWVERLAAISKKAAGKEAAPYDTVALLKHINAAIKILAGK